MKFRTGWYLIFLLGYMNMSYGQRYPNDIISLELSISEKIDSLLSIAEEHTDNSNLDSSILFAQYAFQYSKENDYKIGQAQAEYSMGYTYDINGQLESALEHYELARIFFSDVDDKVEVANCMNAKGVAAYFMGDFELALQYYIPTIEYCEKNSIDNVLANVLNNTGVIYRITDKQNEAIALYHKTIAISRKNDNTDMEATSYHNLGVAYNFADQPQLSIQYLDSAIITFRVLNDVFEVGRSTIAKGETYYLSLKDYVNARKNLEEGLNLISTSYDQEVLSKTYLLLAQVERDDRRFNKSAEYFDLGLALIEDTERDDLISEYYEEMVELYDVQGSTAQAYSYLKKYLNIFTSIQSNEKVEAIEELQTKYETKQKEHQINLLNAKNDLQELQLTSFRNTMILLVLGLILLGGLLYRLYSLNKKVKKSHDEKDTLLREIHHRVKNNLQVISALLTLQSSHLKNAQAKTALQEGQDRVQSMALIHKDLYQHDNLKGVNTKDYLEQLIDNLLSSYKIGEREIALNLDIQEINLDVDTMIPLGLMINELISNALKHAFGGIENGILSISLKEEDATLKMTIADNGVGLDDVGDIQNKSFGYSLIESFARKLDAEIALTNDDGLGVHLTINNYTKV